MFWLSLLAVPATACSADTPRSQADLQHQLDMAGAKCQVDPAMKLRALSGEEATFDVHPDMNADLGKADKPFRCLMAEVQKIPGVRLGFIGNEQNRSDQSFR